VGAILDRSHARHAAWWLRGRIVLPCWLRGRSWDSPFIDNDWIYYDEDDDDFLAGMNDERKKVLKQRWNSLSPDEKQPIHERWNNLSDSQCTRVREASAKP
jgi:hypothetical protein